MGVRGTVGSGRMCTSSICSRVLPPLESQDQGWSWWMLGGGEGTGSCPEKPASPGSFYLFLLTRQLHTQVGGWQEESRWLQSRCTASCWLAFLHLIPRICEMGMVTRSTSGCHED